MALFVRWRRGKSKTGKSRVEFEDHGGVIWEDERFIIRATLFREEGTNRLCEKTLDLTIERHLSNKESEQMAKIVLDLAEYADEEKQVVDKPLKLWIADGEFASGLLRARLSCRVSRGDSEDDLSSGYEDFEVGKGGAEERERKRKRRRRSNFGGGARPPRRTFTTGMR